MLRSIPDEVIDPDVLASASSRTSLSVSKTSAKWGVLCYFVSSPGLATRHAGGAYTPPRTPKHLPSQYARADEPSSMHLRWQSSSFEESHGITNGVRQTHTLSQADLNCPGRRHLFWPGWPASTSKISRYSFSIMHITRKLPRSELSTTAGDLSIWQTQTHLDSGLV